MDCAYPPPLARPAKCQLTPSSSPLRESQRSRPQSDINLLTSPSSTLPDVATGSPPKTPPPAPSKDKRSFLPSFVSDKDGAAKREARHSKLADWFHGESAPMTIGILLSPAKEKSDPTRSSPTDPQRPGEPSSRWSTLASSLKPPAAGTSFSSLFSSKTSHKSPRTQTRGDDPLLSLDVKAALQPQAHFESLSPDAVKEIVRNAENLLSRMQAAYGESQAAIAELHAENEALDEEFEEAETRAKHLKMQLDNMSSKIAEQDSAMMDLVDQLACEKQARREEAEARSRSIRLVSGNGTRPGRRHSRASTDSTFSDSGFESNDESASENGSVPTPARTPSPAASPGSSPYLGPHLPVRGTAQNRSVSAISKTTVFEQPWVSRRTSAGGSNGPADDGKPENERLWRLREENAELRGRVGFLESELDSCLDLLRGMAVG
jgi:hypothetical protein